MKENHRGGGIQEKGLSDNEPCLICGGRPPSPVSYEVLLSCSRASLGRESYSSDLIWPKCRPHQRVTFPPLYYFAVLFCFCFKSPYLPPSGGEPGEEGNQTAHWHSTSPMKLLGALGQVWQRMGGRRSFPAIQSPLVRSGREELPCKQPRRRWLFQECIKGSESVLSPKRPFPPSSGKQYPERWRLPQSKGASVCVCV